MFHARHYSQEDMCIIGKEERMLRYITLAGVYNVNMP